jgi:hypothetical protein
MRLVQARRLWHKVYSSGFSPKNLNNEELKCWRNPKTLNDVDVTGWIPDNWLGCKGFHPYLWCWESAQGVRGCCEWLCYSRIGLLGGVTISELLPIPTWSAILGKEWTGWARYSSRIYRLHMMSPRMFVWSGGTLSGVCGCVSAKP